jgi:hypothetical protein
MWPLPPYQFQAIAVRRAAFVRCAAAGRLAALAVVLGVDLRAGRPTFPLRSGAVSMRISTPKPAEASMFTRVSIANNSILPRMRSEMRG